MELFQMLQVLFFGNEKLELELMLLFKTVSNFTAREAAKRLKRSPLVVRCGLLRLRCEGFVRLVWDLEGRACYVSTGRDVALLKNNFQL